MCSVSVAGMAITALSTAVGMIGQVQSANQQQAAAKAAAEQNAQIAAQEAATQQQLAQNEISKGIADRERQQREAARKMGEMRANMGANGFELDSGSNLSLLAESAQEHQYDSQTIMSNANQAAWQHLVAANSAQNQQSFYQWQGANSKQDNTLALAGTLLGGIGTGIGQYNQYRQQTKTGGGSSLAGNGDKIFDRKS